MATNKDFALVYFLEKGTKGGEVRWEPTAMPSEFTTSLKGKYSVTIGESTESTDDYWLKLVDADNRELLVLGSFEVQGLRALFEEARRRSLNVDAAIDDIIGAGGHE